MCLYRVGDFALLNINSENFSCGTYNPKANKKSGVYNADDIIILVVKYISVTYTLTKI